MVQDTTTGKIMAHFFRAQIDSFTGIAVGLTHATQKEQLKRKG
jgi:hypothetical protein